MQWFWDQYTTDENQQAEITASALRATTEQLTSLPPALVINGEADVLRDEGEASANKLRTAGVPVNAVRYQGIIHDFVMLDALRDTYAAEAAINQAVTSPRHRVTQPSPTLRSGRRSCRAAESPAGEAEPAPEPPHACAM